jgi:hypothetical protein
MRRRSAVAFALSLSLWTADASRADGPARAGASQTRASAEFEEFARAFMREVHSQEARERERPRVAAGPGAAVFTYRGYGDEFRTELRPTGEPSAPFVGLLHYTEHVYSCRDLRGGPCTLADSTPVTEIFRYRNGRWAY